MDSGQAYFFVFLLTSSIAVSFVVLTYTNCELLHCVKSLYPHRPIMDEEVEDLVDIANKLQMLELMRRCEK